MPNLVSTAESIAINILKLESASVTATTIKQSNILENCINIQQLPSRSKFKELPKIVYNNSRGSKDVKDNNNISENKNSEIIKESFKEFQFSKFVQVFSTLAESDPFDEGVPFETLKKSILNLGIAKKN